MENTQQVDSAIPAEVQVMIEKIAAYASRLKMAMRPSAQGITLVDSKGRIAARIDLTGTVTREYAGKALLGALGAAEIRKLLEVK